MNPAIITYKAKKRQFLSREQLLNPSSVSDGVIMAEAVKVVRYPSSSGANVNKNYSVDPEKELIKSKGRFSPESAGKMKNDHKKHVEAHERMLFLKKMRELEL